MSRISAEKRAEIVAAYLENDRATYKDIGERFGISHNTISKIIKAELEAGNGIKPDRRINGKLTDDALDQKHGGCDRCQGSAPAHVRLDGTYQAIECPQA